MLPECYAPAALFCHAAACVRVRSHVCERRVGRACVRTLPPGGPRPREVGCAPSVPSHWLTSESSLPTFLFVQFMMLCIFVGMLLLHLFIFDRTTVSVGQIDFISLPSCSARFCSGRKSRIVFFFSFFFERGGKGVRGGAGCGAGGNPNSLNRGDRKGLG